MNGPPGTQDAAFGGDGPLPPLLTRIQIQRQPCGWCDRRRTIGSVMRTQTSRLECTPLPRRKVYRRRGPFRKTTHNHQNATEAGVSNRPQKNPDIFSRIPENIKTGRQILGVPNSTWRQFVTLVPMVLGVRPHDLVPAFNVFWYSVSVFGYPTTYAG